MTPQELLEFYFTAESYLSEYDDWTSTNLLCAAKLNLVRKYGEHVGTTEDMIMSIEDSKRQSQKLAAGAMEELSHIFDTDDIEDIRSRIFKLRTLLTKYGEQMGVIFIEELPSKDTAFLLRAATSLITGEEIENLSN